MIEQAKQILTDTFGYNEFRSMQKEVMEQVLNKKDALVIMPTGGGKSLCYQIPALIFDGLTVVVSPLISLMKDQVDQLRQFDIPALYLNSSLTPEQYEFNVKRLKRGDAKLLYVAPETLLMDKTQELLADMKVECLTIDEAHCISEWGHDFRPDYRKLANVRETFPGAVCMALTATATPRVQEDIKRSLKFEDSEAFVASFDRKNLFLKVVDKQNPTDQVLDFLYDHRGESGIIYCFSRRQVDELYMDLKDEGHSVRPYHAGLSDRDRAKNQLAFIRDDIQIIVATIAFGMGINKPNVRFVIHYDMPQNIESYYQQIGRAGRDGLSANCLLLFSYKDTQKINYFISKKEGKEQDVAKEHLDQLVKYLETKKCRRIPLLKYFGEEYPHKECGMCDNDVSESAKVEDITVHAQKFLSCMKRTGEQYGVNYIADVLRGSKSQKVIDNNHNQLSTYGIGKDLTKKQWLQIGRELIRLGYVKQGLEYANLIANPEAERVLDGKEIVLGVMELDTETRFTDAGQKTRSEVEKNYNKKLFDKLRDKRKELADASAIPPYAIFPDTTLMEMAYYFPKTSDKLIHLYGVGDAKLSKYGLEFMRIIRDFAEEHGIEEKETKIKEVAEASKTDKKKYEIVGEAYNSGQTIARLAEEHGVKDVTILKHLKDYMNQGNTLDPDGLIEHTSLSRRQQDAVIKSFDKLGAKILRPAYDDLNKQISYNELQVMQLYYLAKNGK